jgi:hypothetical protein
VTDIGPAGRQRRGRTVDEPSTGLPPVVEELLGEIVTDGFVLYCCGHRDRPNALLASYQWEHYLDLVTIRSFDRITAARIPTPHREKVNIFAPEVVVWAYEGPPEYAVQALLELVSGGSRAGVC